MDFRWDYREDYRRPVEIAEDDAWTPPTPGSKARVRYHHGFIAQEVANLANEMGIDFAGYQDHSKSGGEDVLSLGYSELLAPIVKAIQEISVRLDVIENK